MSNGLGELELELEGLGEFEGEFESEFEGFGETENEGEFEFEGFGESEGEFESEFELETEYETEGINPVNRIYPDAMMEHLGRAAMEAETEFEAAEHFLPLIPMVASKLLPLAAKALPKIAGKVLPRVAKVIMRATPRLTRSVATLTRTLHRNPQTRGLVRVIPSVARRAVTTIAKRAAAGHPVSPRQAVRILALERRHLMRNPKILRSVLRRSRIMDRHLHRLGGFPPHYRYRYGAYPAPVADSLGARGWRAYGRPASVTAWGPGPVAGDRPYRGPIADSLWGGGRRAYVHPASIGAWGSGPGRVAGGVCPTCGGMRTRGVRRVCCCC